MEYPTEYRRKLPHIQPENGVFFVTFRLVDSLPKSIVEKLNQYYKSDLLNHKKNKLGPLSEFYDSSFEYFDSELDNSQNETHWLKDKRIATIVKDSILFFDSKKYKVICFCIMSNHVHLIIYKLHAPLFRIMQSLKSFSAKECNKILERKGRFWQREYYDRLVRNKNDLGNKIKYTLNNPVKAGLVDNWEDWEFSFCRNEFNTLI